MNVIDQIKKKIATRKFVEDKLQQMQKRLLYSQKASELTQLTLNSTTQGITEKKYCDHDIIVSLTSYGRRLNEVYLPIESIMQGSMKPNRIILWLQDDLQDTPLPLTLQLQQKRGLEIMYCEDIKSYKKLIPSLLKFPNDAIVTIDDDLIYAFDLLENLVNPYLKAPQYIYSHRSHKILLNEDGTIKKYNEWVWEQVDYTPTRWACPTGVGGTLYPPHCLDDEVLNKEVFMSICSHADDIWFKAMSLKKGTLVCSVFSHDRHGNDYLINEDAQSDGLLNYNVDGGGNDVQIKAVFDKYDLYKCLM